MDLRNRETVVPGWAYLPTSAVPHRSPVEGRRGAAPLDKLLTFLDVLRKIELLLQLDRVVDVLVLCIVSLATTTPAGS